MRKLLLRETPDLSALNIQNLIIPCIVLYPYYGMKFKFVIYMEITWDGGPYNNAFLLLKILNFEMEEK